MPATNVHPQHSPRRQGSAERRRLVKAQERIGHRRAWWIEQRDAAAARVDALEAELADAAAKVDALESKARP